MNLFSAPVGHDGRLYVGINRGGSQNFFALNPDTLAVEWQARLEGGITTSAAIGWDGAIYVGTANGRFYCLDPLNATLFGAVRDEVLQDALLGLPGTTYEIQESTDLTTWTRLNRVHTHNGLVPLHLSLLPPPSHRFYRAVVVP